MIGFEIAIDGQRICTAAVGDLGVLSAVVSWVRRASRESSVGTENAGRFEQQLTFHVGGLALDSDGAREDLTWLDQPLRLGQRISLTVVDTPETDPPQARHREDPAWADQRKREYYERLKREYGDA
jgi:hypothetical protein